MLKKNCQTGSSFNPLITAGCIYNNKQKISQTKAIPPIMLTNKAIIIFKNPLINNFYLTQF